MRRIRQEKPGDERETWCYEGRRLIEGTDCYVWMRYLAQPEPGTGYVKKGIALPVAEFWPNADAVAASHA